tara:strand:- start:259 stop:1893 length:1635 start_codon:yes stop_codon:yes gene_type:complete
MTVRFDPIRRRLFLTGIGGAALALPWLPSLLPRSLRPAAKAQEAPVPRRFVALKTYNGAPVLDWYPLSKVGYGTHPFDGTLQADQRLPTATGRHASGSAYFGRFAPLMDLVDGGISNVFGPALTPFVQEMNLFRGLDFMPGLNHNYGGYLGNFGLNTNGTGGPVAGAQINATIDHVMPASSAVYPMAPAGPRVLHVGSRANTSSYAPVDPGNPLAVGQAAIQQAQAHTNPRAAFDAVFGTLPEDPMAGPGTSELLIDHVLGDYRRAMDGPHLSMEDKRSLDAHVTRLTELQRSLGGGMPGVVGCDPVAPAALDTGGEFSVAVPDVRTLFENLVDVVVLALACDATRVVTLDVTKMVIADGGETFGMGDSENANSAGRDNWHFQAHQWDDNARRWLGQGARWVADFVVARLLQGLQDTTERDGESLLHHSMVMWSNELSFNHLNYSMPTVMWGRAGGRLRTGRYLDYTDWERPIRFRQHDGSVVEGVQFNRLLVTLMQAMGLEPSEYEREAGRGYGEYRPVGKGDGFALDYDESTVGQPLPDLMV